MAVWEKMNEKVKQWTRVEGEGERGKYKTQGVEMRRQAIKEGTNRSGPAQNFNGSLI